MMTEETKSKIVQLDVGGTLYKVSRDTLERCEGSMLSSLISDQWKEGNTDEPIFIDRNGRLFEHVLDYLRASKVFLPSTVNIDAVKEEFEFYGIDADMSEVHEKYGHKYLHELNERIRVQEESLYALKAEAHAIQASMMVEHEFFKELETPYVPIPEEYRPKRHTRCIDLPEEYRPFDKETLRTCLQQRGFKMNRADRDYVSVEDMDS
jgi:hypothetical protein